VTSEVRQVTKVLGRAVLFFWLVCGSAGAGAQSPSRSVSDGFEAKLRDGWAPLGGEWQVQNGKLRARGTGDLAWTETVWRDVEVEVQVAIADCLNPAYWAGIRLRTDSSKGPGSGYLVYLRRNGSLEIFTQGKILAAAPTKAVDRLGRGEPVRLGARVTGTRIEGLLDGEVAVQTDHDELRWGEVALALALYDCTTVFDDFQCRGTTAGGIIYGEVLNRADQLPVADVAVETYHSMDGYPSKALAGTRTDREGRFTLEGLPAGERAYWVRACKDGCGGGTGWFVTVSDSRPTNCDLMLLDAPPAAVWMDSAALDAADPWQEIVDPQCYGGSRKVLRCDLSRAAGQSLECRFRVSAGTYVLRVGCGLYPELHYWSPVAWRLDGGEWQEAAKSLALDPQRYGDRLSLAWARTEPLSLLAGEHTLSLRPTARWAGAADEVYWTFDALAVEQLPEPAGPATTSTNRPVLRWRSAAGGEVVLQLSAEPDFSDGTLTVPHLRGGKWQIPADLRLPDGAYWWRLKSLPAETSYFRGTFGPAAKLVVATSAPAVSNVRTEPTAPDHAVISWLTDQPYDSYVLWDLSASAPRYRTAPTRSTRNSVALAGLQPATCYRYWIVVQGPDGDRRTLRRQFLTRRGKLAGKQSPFGIFGQELPYAKELADAGVRWMSDYWDWATLEPERGRFAWAQADQRMDRAERHGLNLTVTFWGSPLWSRRTNGVRSPSHPNEHGWDCTYGPDDLAATREFFRAVAAHCGRRVDWFLPWIEPNVARDPVFGFPRGYWASRPHAQTYAAHQRAAYEGAKSGNPDCRVVGMNTAGVDLAFIEKCYDEGAADTFDVMNVHYYAMTGDFEKQDPEGMFAGLRRLMAQYGDARKPVYCSEGGGTSSGLPDTDEALQAANLVRLFVLSIANDIDKLSWTFAYDEKEYGSKRVDMIMWMGLFRFDADPTHKSPDLRGEPKPSYHAYRTMTRLLDGTEFACRLHTDEGLRAYRFERRDDGRPTERVTAVWSEQGERSLALDLAGRVTECCDYLGRPVDTPVRDREARVVASPSPVFVVEALP